MFPIVLNAACRNLTRRITTRQNLGYAYRSNKRSNAFKKEFEANMRINNLDSKMNSMDLKMNSINSKMNSMDLKMDSINSKMNNINLKMNDIDWNMKMVPYKTTGYVIGGLLSIGSLMGMLGWNVHLLIKPNEEVKVPNTPSVSNVFTRFFKFPPEK